MNSELPFAPASERNKRPILECLRLVAPQQGEVLEIGSGTGQHAVFFAERLPGLSWQASERSEELEGLNARIKREAGVPMPAAICLEIERDPWPNQKFDLVFSSNTCHIMSWSAVQAMMRGVGELLREGGCLCIYGPFNRSGEFTAPSNEDFDRQLRLRHPQMGLRDIEAVEQVGHRQGLVMEAIWDMPANNFFLVLRKTRAGEIGDAA